MKQYWHEKKSKVCIRYETKHKKQNTRFEKTVLWCENIDIKVCKNQVEVQKNLKGTKKTCWV